MFCVGKVQEGTVRHELFEYSACPQVSYMFTSLTDIFAHGGSFALPDDIFDAGEVKPMKPVKKKRPAAEVGRIPSSSLAHILDGQAQHGAQ